MAPTLSTLVPALTQDRCELGLELIHKALEEDGDFRLGYRKLALRAESLQDDQQQLMFTVEELNAIISTSTCQLHEARKGSEKPLRWDNRNKKIQKNELRVVPSTGPGAVQNVDEAKKENSKSEAPYETMTLTWGKNPKDGPTLQENSKNKGQRGAKTPLQCTTVLLGPVRYPCSRGFPAAAAHLIQGQEYTVTSIQAFPSMDAFMEFLTASRAAYSHWLQSEEDLPPLPSQLLEEDQEVVMEENSYACLDEEGQQVLAMESVKVKLRNTFWDKDVAEPQSGRCKSYLVLGQDSARPASQV